MCIELKRIIKSTDIIIRNITDKDHYDIESVAKRAFWNLNMPGCDEHYLVHRLWNEPCYISELSLAAEVDNKIVGAILYSKAKIKTNHGNIGVLTFGPLCVDPDHQKMGIGQKLLLESMRLATENGYQAILICGVPTYYPKFGFKTADTFRITMPDGSNFDAFMGYELRKDALKGVTGKFYEDPFFDCDVHDEAYMKAVDEFDKNFPYMEKKILPHQWR